MTTQDPIVIAIDQGTTGTTVFVLESNGHIRSRAAVEVPQHFPGPAMVEHNPDEIWSGVQTAIANAIEKANVQAKQVAAIGITNQRETTVVWDRRTGQPIHNAIVWQDRRTTSMCEQLRERNVEPMVYERTGLVLDPYFSGTKVAWLLDHVNGARSKARNGELAFGTIDSWLVHKLTGAQRHATDVTNASRTLLFNVNTLAWDDELLRLLDIPSSVLPDVVASAEIVGHTKGLTVLPDGIPIAGIAGDQQSALFGQCCFGVGDVKCTYGTGAFVLMNVGDKPVASKHRLLTTVAWKIPGETRYALEGSSFIAGAAVQWLRDGLKMIRSASEIEGLARSVESSSELVFVPALTGLGAPHWAPYARGMITGIGRDTTVGHIARATLEGIALSVADLVEAMGKDAGANVSTMKVDGGAAANDLLMEIQSALVGAPVVRPKVVDTTALGAGLLAILGAGLAKDKDELAGQLRVDKTFLPEKDNSISREHALGLKQKWTDALARVLLPKAPTVKRA